MLLEDSLVVLGSNTAVVGSISDDYVSSPRQENFDGDSDSNHGCGIGDSSKFGSMLGSNFIIQLIIDPLCVLCVAKDFTSTVD